MRHQRGDEGPEPDLPPWAARDGARRSDDDGYVETGLRWPHGVPGSPEALAAGCLCPVLPNDPRAGLGLLNAPDCPVHA